MQSPRSHGMQNDLIYRDCVVVGTSASSLVLTGATLPYDVRGHPPPKKKRPLTHHSGHDELCEAQIKHIDQLEPSYYRFESTGLCKAQDPKECKFTLCHIAVTWWIALSCCNMLSSMAPVHTGTKAEVARISKKFSHRVANFGAWQGSSE